VRFREDTPEDLNRADATVRAWREANPDGTAEQLLAALGPDFHPDYGPVLRAVLYIADKHRARQGTSAVPGPQDSPVKHATAGFTTPENLTATIGGRDDDPK